MRRLVRNTDGLPASNGLDDHRSFKRFVFNNRQAIIEVDPQFGQVGQQFVVVQKAFHDDRFAIRGIR